MSTLETTIEWESRINAEGETDVIEREITIEFNYAKGCRGARGSCGEPIEPDEPPNIEIVSVILVGSGPFGASTEDILGELSNAQREHLEGLCLEQVASDYEREQEERNDYRR